MSAAVRAALAAKRAEHRSRSVSPSKPSIILPNGDGGDTARNHLPNFGSELDASIASPFGSPKPSSRSNSAAANRIDRLASAEMDLNQKSEEDIVKLSIQNGQLLPNSIAHDLRTLPIC